MLAVSFSEVVSDLSIFEMTPQREVSPFPLALTKTCRIVAKQTCVLTNGAILNRHLRKILLQNYLDDQHEDNPLVHFAKTGVVDVPKARVDRLSKSVPCPLKNIDIKFLPFNFNRMVRKYWRNHAKEKNRALSQPNDLNQIPAQHNSNIIIIQDGSRTQIILPSSYSTAPQTVYLTSQENGPVSQQQPQPPAPTPPTGPHTFPSFAIHRKPVNTVTPTPITTTPITTTPITTTVSSANLSFPQTSNVSASFSPPAETPVGEFTNQGFMKPPLPIPLPSSVSPCTSTLMPPPRSLFPKPHRSSEMLLPPPLPPPQRKPEFGGKLAKKIPREESGGTDRSPLPNTMTSYLFSSHLYSSPGVASVSYSPSKISSVLGVTDTPDSPLLHMPFLIDTPCKPPQLSVKRPTSTSPEVSPVREAAEKSLFPNEEVKGVPKKTSPFGVHPRMGCSSGRESNNEMDPLECVPSKNPSKKDSLECSLQKSPCQNNFHEYSPQNVPNGNDSPERDPTEFESKGCSSQRDHFEVDSIRFSSALELQPSSIEKGERKCEAPPKDQTKGDGDSLPHRGTSSTLSDAVYSTTANDARGERQKRSSGEREGTPASPGEREDTPPSPGEREDAPSLPFPRKKLATWRPRREEGPTNAPLRKVEKTLPAGKDEEKTQEKYLMRTRNSRRKSVRTENQEDDGERKTSEKEEGGPMGQNEKENSSVQSSEDTVISDDNVNEGSERMLEGMSVCEEVERERQVITEPLEEERTEWEGEDYPSEINQRKDSPIGNESMESESEEGKEDDSTLEERKEGNKENSSIESEPAEREYFLVNNGPLEKEKEEGKSVTSSGSSEPINEREWNDDRSGEMEERSEYSSEGNFKRVVETSCDVREPERRNNSDSDAEGCMEEDEGTSEVDREEEEEQEETFEMSFFRKVKENLAKEDPSKFLEFLSILRAFASRQDSAEGVYFEVLKVLWGFPDLQLEFLILLNPDQARRVGKYSEYCVMQCVKNLFDASKKSCHDPVDQTEVIRDLRLVLTRQIIPKAQLLELLKPILSARPDIVLAVTDGLDPEEEEPLHVPKENAAVSQGDSVKEKSDAVSMSISSPSRCEISLFPTSSRSKESTSPTYSPDEKQAEENVVHHQERGTPLHSLPSSGSEEISGASADNEKNEGDSSLGTPLMANASKNIKVDSRYRGERRKNRNDCARSQKSKKPTCPRKSSGSNCVGKLSKLRSSGSTDDGDIVKKEVLKENKTPKRQRKALSGTLETKMDDGKRKVKRDGSKKKSVSDEGKGESTRTKKMKTYTPQKVRRLKVTNGKEEKDCTRRKKNDCVKGKGRQHRKSKEQNAKVEGKRTEKVVLKRENSKWSPRKEENNRKAVKAEAITWTKEEDRLLINSVQSKKRLTTNIFKTLTESLRNKTEAQVKERLNFILELLVKYSRLISC